MTSEGAVPQGRGITAGPLDLALARRLHRALTGSREEIFVASRGCCGLPGKNLSKLS